MTPPKKMVDDIMKGFGNAKVKCEEYISPDGQKGWCWTRVEEEEEKEE